MKAEEMEAKIADIAKVKQVNVYDFVKNHSPEEALDICFEGMSHLQSLAESMVNIWEEYAPAFAIAQAKLEVKLSTTLDDGEEAVLLKVELGESASKEEVARAKADGRYENG